MRRPTLPSSSMAYWTRVRQAGTSPGGSLSPSAGMTVPSQPASSGVRPARRWSCSAITSPLSRRWAPGLACCQSQPPHLPGPAYGQGASTRSLDASMIRTASARRKRESLSPSVTLATTFSPGSVWRTKRTWPSGVRAMQWPPCATGPTSTSYSSPTSDDVGSFCMRGWLQGSRGRERDQGKRPGNDHGRTTTYDSTWVSSGRLPRTEAGRGGQLLPLGSLGLRSTGPRRTAPGAFHSARFLARFLAASEDSS